MLVDTSPSRKFAPLALLIVSVVSGCTGNESNGPTRSSFVPSVGDGGTATVGDGGLGPDAAEEASQAAKLLASRELNYGEALRTASLKLAGALPKFETVKAILDATSDGDKKTLYEKAIDDLLASPEFVQQQIKWWRNTFRTGAGPGQDQGIDFDSAAMFAASLVASDKPYTDLFTSATGNCPTFANGTFTPKDCGQPPQAGILTNPGIMAQFYANMAFRRVRFVQETFVCTKFPAEYNPKPTAMGSGLYTSPWPLTSVTGGKSARIDFQDTSSVICANRHTTMNHLAPLFANFNDKGQFVPNQIQVVTPVESEDPEVRRARLSDWLPEGQTPAWRNGTPVADLPALGAVMAKDAEIPRCAVNRVWNWAMSRGDIVNDLASVPPSVTASLTTQFVANGMKVKPLIRAVFTADDFVKF